MLKNQKDITEFMRLAGQETPEKPTIPDEKTRVLRVRLLLEEVLELAEASGVRILNDENVPVKFNKLKYEVSMFDKPDLIGILDAISDIDYVNTGAATAYGLDLEPAIEEVHRSNMTKFIDGHRNEHGKWIKGPSYTPADFKKIVDDQK